MKWLILILFLWGCETQIVEPTWDKLSGVYKSVAYESTLSYDLSLEIIQKDNEIFGTITKDKVYSLKGMIKDGRINLSFEKGWLDVWVDSKGDYYPLAGGCVWDGEMRAVRFELVNKIHDQGELR